MDRLDPRRLTLALALVSFAVLFLRTAWIADDAYITFRVVDNAIAGYGLRWNIDERVQVFTHPLWCLLLVAVRVVVPYTHYVALALCFVCSLAALIVVLRQAPHAPALAVGAAILLLSASFNTFSSSGLENPLTHLLLALFAAAWLGPVQGRTRTFVLFALAALLAANRLDTLALVAPALAYHVWKERSPGWLPAALLGLVPLLAWEAFAVVYYGFAVPNTAYAKLNTGVSGYELAALGFIYLSDSVVRDPLTPAVIAASLVLSAWCSPRQRLLVLGIVLYIAYVVRVGGDFMSGRFLTAPLLLATVVLQQHIPNRPWFRWAVPMAAVLALSGMAEHPVLTIDAEFGRGSALRREIADERQYYYRATGLLREARGRHTPVHHWADRGRQARRTGSQVELADAIGFVAYLSGPRVHLVDVLGLCDAFLARLPRRLGPWRIGHLYRRMPEGYRDTAIGDHNQIAEPPLARYYDALSAITRGPIWSAGRFRTIAAMNLGRYEHLIAESSYGTRTVEASALFDRVPEGTRYDDPAVFQVLEGGILIRLARPVAVRRAEISVDANDVYVVTLMRDGRRLTSTTIPSSGFDQVGQRTRFVEFAKVDGPVDALVVRAGAGDRRAALGHLRVFP